MPRRTTSAYGTGEFDESVEENSEAESTTEETAENGQETDSTPVEETDENTAEIASIEFHADGNIYVVVFAGNDYPLIIPGNELSPEQDDQDIVGRIEYELSQRIPVEAFAGLRGKRVRKSSNDSDNDVNIPVRTTGETTEDTEQ